MSQTIKPHLLSPMLIDHHTAKRQAFIRMETKRQAALEYLGVRWVFHPLNSDHPRKLVKGGF